MTFLKTLTKDGWTIYVYSLPGHRYMIEYSNDGFGSKERKEYESKDELLKMMSKRIADSISRTRQIFQIFKLIHYLFENLSRIVDYLPPTK